jgi:signal transduction histidine kinase
LFTCLRPAWVEDLLDLSRLTLGKLHLEMAPIGLTTAVQEAVAMIRPQAEGKHIAMNVTLPRNPCVIRGDALRLQQICWNLLSNAVKFTPDGGRVDVSLLCNDHTIEMRIDDNGEGISPELLPRLFEPFRQGNGATAKVAVHHGEVEAQSDGVWKGRALRGPTAGGRRIILTARELSR